jgi:outer membrane protein OmpA-like peptidoglycan-associated protein
VKNLIAMFLIIGLVFVCFGCGWSKAQKGAAIGASSGGAAGGVIGHKMGNTAIGAIAGAAIGGVAGGYIGKYMDKQAAEMKSQVKDVTVERVDEGIALNFDSALLFDFGKSTLRSETKTNLDKLAEILQKYPDTNIIVEGNTDSVGSEESNQKLSEQRAQAVGDYLVSINVGHSRLTTMGRGETQPTDTNLTAEGRQANRRVEIAIIANDTLKEKARADAS